MEQSLFEKIKVKVENYMKALENIGIAQYEKSKIQKSPQTEEELLAALDVIFESSKELNMIFEESPNSFFVCDADGECLRVNKSYEKMVKMSRHEVLGKNVADLDSDGIFRPSVCLLTLIEKRPISVLQDIRDVKRMAVTGVPVFDENGTLFRVVTNAVKVDEMNSLTRYMRGKEKCENREHKKEKKEIIAESKAMKEVLALADVIKNTESNVLITGETGVGKGVLAAYIHETSNRAEKRMVSINCGAIPENLLESELFGYESGAFTGADKKGKPGLIELSDGGTLFLDEISELPLMLQVKILHFLQTKKLTRVGGTREIPIDTRIIAASNRALELEVERGTFRSDLYYRINVIPIYIPPLRERRDDLGAITQHFLDIYMKKYNKKMKMDEETMHFIMNHDWRGNVRELENYIERMVVTNESGWVLSLEQDGMTQENGKKDALNKTVEEVEKDIIIKAYEQYKSSYKVAEVLGISQSTAYRRIKKYIKESQN
ncbi:sigma 54-interacting transcriptional regulator [Anaerovorax odorimutans]|uniref:HTH-type transcriptional regulatory protein TyrR n=1 Tax=Anaerovorax odorimutans TaxID=109327 RepID=A0ABT1RK53_9FIRM|nr:sigma 54-interacting transcriptional regulator [Anaerovorax odorimutans]MCQ4635554.1 sigma 54-interacting transcriptional regulator [Anaerovorax odorimutans]